MKYRISSYALFLAITIMLNFAYGADKSSGKCDVGPLKKIYGNMPWLVYSCTTTKKVVIVSAPGSPARPFVFCFCIMRDGSYGLYGEGTGNKEAADAALSELKKLTVPDVENLIMQTKQVQEQVKNP
jgi:hypothetical protein